MSRIDMLDALASGFGIVEPGCNYDNNSDAYKWRWLCDELVQAMSDAQACDLMSYVARMNDIDLTDVDE